MSNDKQEESKEAFRQVQDALYQIHSMADVLGMIIAENSSAIGTLKSMSPNKVSCPFISFTDMIREKAEFCIEKIDETGIVR